MPVRPRSHGLCPLGRQGRPLHKGLLHSHKTYLYGLERQVQSHTFGDVREGELFDIWNSKAYADFRDKVKAFDFSPCHVCGGCSLLENNTEDCYGNTFPACGGCLSGPGVDPMPMKDVVKIFKALADPTRLRIVLLLRRVGSARALKILTTSFMGIG